MVSKSFLEELKMLLLRQAGQKDPLRDSQFGKHFVDTDYDIGSIMR